MLKSKSILFLYAALMCALLSAGCSSEKATQYTPEEKAKFNAPLGQPMPPEAKAAMEKMGQGGPPAGGAPGGPPPGPATATPAPKAPAPQ